MDTDVRDALVLEAFPLPDGWRWRWLDEVMEIRGGAQPPASTFVDTPRPGYVRFVQIRDFDGDDHLTYIEDSSKWRKCSKNDVLIARYGASLGRILRGLEGAYNVALVKAVPKDDVELDFLFYLLKSEFFQSKLQGLGGRSAQSGFNKEDLSVIPVPVPPPHVQRSIAGVVQALDNKIKLNRQMNGTLEMLAQAVFKEWFVEKVEETWEEKTIGDIAEVVGGTTPSTKKEAFWSEQGHAWSTPKDLSSLQTPVLLDTERHLTDEGLAEIGSGLLPIGTVLMSSRAPIGYIAIAEVPTAVNQGFIAMKPKPGISNLFLWQWTNQNMDEIKSRANGSTFQEISKASFRPIAVAVPPSDKMEAYDALVRPMYERLVANERESRTLTALRDTLLPRLMRGEVRVKSAVVNHQ